MAKEDANNHEIELKHPVYLDTPMLVSFLAALDDGFSYSSEIDEKLEKNNEIGKAVGAKAGLSNVLNLLGLSVSAEGSYSTASRENEAIGTKVVREHTSASLFNKLYERLLANGSINSQKALHPVGQTEVGDLVEISGTVTKDPLRQVVELVTSITPYMKLGQPDKTPQQKGNNRSGNPQRRESKDAYGLKVFEVLREDLGHSNVLDLIVENETNSKNILTVTKKFIDADTEEYLLGGEFRVLGKVTKVFGENEEINLLRRTTVGIFGKNFIEPMIEQFAKEMANSAPGLKLSSDTTIQGPGVQLLPLAIFV